MMLSLLMLQCDGVYCCNGIAVFIVVVDDVVLVFIEVFEVVGVDFGGIVVVDGVVVVGGGGVFVVTR